jgi:small-conductance mechanosensitive channel
VIDALARSSSLVLAALLCVAIAHKVSVLRAGEADRQPLLRKRGWSPERAAAALAVAAVAEAVVALAVVLVPPVGLLALAALLAAYTVGLRELDADESCACLGEFLDRAGRAVAIRRNVVLVAVAVAAAAAYLTGAAQRVEPAQVDVGLAALAAAVILARAALERQFTTREEHLGETT